jgi:glycosidase
MRVLFLLLGAALALPVLAQEAPPAWAEDAVWYQIFPERFRNGDPSNDPTPESMEGAWPQVGAARLREAGWQPTPWGHDWYRQEPWAEALGEPFYFTAQLRRYGGDLQGVLDGLDYLRELGVTALYVNPLNDAPSLHKYDARTYRHVDPHFGPDPAGDRAIIAAENPADPETWQWTAADQFFLQLIRAVHERGMRLVLDYSWNHTGTQFWAFQDVLAHGADSPYADWYRIERWDDPATPDTNEFAYSGWAGVRELPELGKVNLTGNPHAGEPYDGDLAPGPKAHIFAVTRRWLDPNGDGDPSDGVDGFRLDVAEMVPLGFWRDYHRLVKSINPEALLVGEIWWEQWPTRMKNPAPYLGDVFDSVMHYRWFEPARRLVTGAPPALTIPQFAAHLDSVYAEIPETHVAALMNVAGTHDAPRLATTLYNPHSRYKTRETPREDSLYRVDAPDETARRAQRLVLTLQFTLPGTPALFYGDEAGLWGADDPDDRKPMLWADLTYEDEIADPLGRAREPDVIAPDLELLGFYHDLIALRKAHAELFSHGTLEWIESDGARDVLIYRRGHGDAEVVVVLNLGESGQAVQVEAGLQPALTVGSVAAIPSETLMLAMDGRAAAVLVRTP